MGLSLWADRLAAQLHASFHAYQADKTLQMELA